MTSVALAAALLALGIGIGGEGALACGNGGRASLAARADSVARPADLPLVEQPATRAGGRVLALVLSGDGGWAEIDQRISRTLAGAGVGVVGLDSRKYLAAQSRSPDGAAADVARVLRHYLAAWHRDSVVLVGYSRGADMVPFVTNRLPSDLRGRVRLLALLGLASTANFEFHWSDLLHTTARPSDIPILPELQRIHGLRVMCVYGRDEVDSLCRSAPPGLVEALGRDGKHHFDRDYEAIAKDILARM